MTGSWRGCAITHRLVNLITTPGVRVTRIKLTPQQWDAVRLRYFDWDVPPDIVRLLGVPVVVVTPALDTLTDNRGDA
jgi:hypothetical protein